MNGEREWKAYSDSSPAEPGTYEVKFGDMGYTSMAHYDGQQWQPLAEEMGSHAFDGEEPVTHWRTW